MGINLRRAEIARCAVVEANFIDTDLCEAVTPESDFTGTTFNRCDLSKADMASARGLYVDPARNKVKGLLVPLETAVALALEAGMKVPGF